MKGAGSIAGRSGTLHINKENICVLCSDNVNRQWFNTRASKGFTKKLRWLNACKNTPISVIVHSLKLYAAFKNNAKILCLLPLGKYCIAFFIAFFLCTETSERSYKALVLYLIKKRTFTQNFKIFFHFFSFCWNFNRLWILIIVYSACQLKPWRRIRTRSKSAYFLSFLLKISWIR